MARPIPEGADRTVFDLQATDSHALALTAAQLGHTKLARTPLDYAFSCGEAAGRALSYERAGVLGSLVVPNLSLGRVEAAREVWMALEQPLHHRITFLHACIRIGSDCTALKSDMPDDLVAAICGAIEQT